jgi:MoxR-like ATPase
VHVAARLAQLDEVIAHAQGQRDTVAAQAGALADALRGRLWLPPTLGARWQAAHAHTLAVLDALLHRARAARAGFSALPLDAGMPALAPEALAWAPG